ncbi:MAG: hypothetical protein MJY59_01500 [Bacteroidaceae bacterium]|nr:hypothetical protein [Bacteroidaceae bacterium]
MKRLTTILLTAVLLLASCSSDDNEGTKDSPTSHNPYYEYISGTLTKCERPDWKVMPGLSYSSMCMIIDEFGIPCKIDSCDMVAAFVDGCCRGMAHPIFDSSEYYWRYNLSIFSIPEDEGRQEIFVEVRYYSATLGGTFTALSFPYTDGSRLGENRREKGHLLDWL